MAEAGFVSLLIALALSVYGMIGSVVGKGIGAHQLQESAKRTAYLVPAALLISTLALVMAFLRRDFSLEYVAGHSNLAMDPVYTWVAFYAGNEGSLLYIAFVLSLMTAGRSSLCPQVFERQYALYAGHSHGGADLFPWRDEPHGKIPSTFCPLLLPMARASIRCSPTPGCSSIPPCSWPG